MTAGTPVVTLDGPGATGKGTLGLRLAAWLGWHVLDSGALYRALARRALRAGAALDDDARLAAFAAGLKISFHQEAERLRVFLGSREVSAELRREEVGRVASLIAARPAVRSALLQAQRAFLHPPGLVADGRDMGTVVFPRAALKLYLTASPEERTLRRHQQLQDLGLDAKMKDLADTLSERDRRDGTRAVAPMRPAPDAVVIDTTECDREQAFARAVQLVRGRFRIPGPRSPECGSLDDQ